MLSKKAQNRLILGLIIFTLLLGTIFIFAQDTGKEEKTKSYDSVNKIVSIKDSKSDKVADIQLKSPVIKKSTSASDNYFEIEIDNNLDKTKEIIDGVKYYEYKKGVVGKELIKSNHWEYFDDKIENKEYFRNCYENLSFPLSNKTVCETVENITYGSWVAFDNLKELPIGKIKLRNYVQMNEFEWVEYVPTFYGVEIPEWAILGNDGYTLMLLHFDGAVGSTTIIDSAVGNTTAHTFTPTGVTIDTNWSKFGNASEYQTAGDTIAIADSVDWTTAMQSNFTWDFWVNVSSKPSDDGSGATGRKFIMGSSTCTGNPNCFQFFVYNTGWGTTTNVAETKWVDTITVGRVYHLALEMVDGNLRLYRDGGSLNGGGAQALAIDPTGFTLAGYSTNKFTGFLDEVRISSTARWLANFTPAIGPYDAVAADNPPVVTLTNLSSYQNLTSLNNIFFNCSATDDNNVTNITLYLDGVKNKTQIIGLTSGELTNTVSLTYSGLHNYSCTAYDNATQSTTASRFFNIGLNVSGYTKDESGNALTGMRVIIINQSSNVSMGSSVSNGGGSWTYGPLTTGNYTIIGYDSTNSSRAGGIKTFVSIP